MKKSVKKRRKKKSKIWKSTRKVVGVILIIFGIISLFLPLSPGIILILLGLAVAGNEEIKDKIEKWIKKRMKIRKNKESKKLEKRVKPSQL